MATLSFTITGEFMTETSRNMVLEDNATGAINVLKEGLIGITYDQVYMILKGTHKLIGENNDIGMVEEEDDVRIPYQERLDDKYAGVTRIKGDQYMKPYAYVRTWGPEDMRFARAHADSYGLDWGSKNDLCTLSKTRSLYYADDRRGDKVVEQKTNTGLELQHVIFKLCESPPPWINAARTMDDGLKAFLNRERWSLERRGWESEGSGLRTYRRLRKAGADDDAATATIQSLSAGPRVVPCSEEDMNDEVYKVALQKKHEAIVAYAKELDTPFHEIEFDGEKYMIPEAPFALWAAGARKTNMYNHLLPDWDPLCDSGMRMQLDDPFHSDWMLGAGVKLFDHPNYRDVNEVVWDLMEKVNAKYLSFGGNAFLCGGTYMSGDIVLAKPNERVEDGAIALAPNASPSYLLAALSASVLIVGAGGTMCHLATVGREKGSNILLVPDAMKKLKPKMRITITEDGKLEIHENRTGWLTE